MPNPTFEPIIGSGFDDVARQRAQWAGFSNRIDEGNIARAAQAQREANNWLMTVAQMNREDAARRAAQEQRAMELGLTRADQARREAIEGRRYDEGTTEAKREFDIGQQFRQSALQQADSQATAKVKLAQLQQDQGIDHRGQVFAQQYAELNRAAQGAEGNAEQLDAESEAADKRITELAAKGKKITPEEALEMGSLQKRKNDLKVLVRHANSAKTMTDRALNRLLDSINSHDYSVDEDTGAIIHSPTGKRFNFRAALKEAQARIAPLEAGAPTYADAMRPFEAYSPDTLSVPAPAAPAWAGFAPQPEPGLTATNQPIQIGRFKVVAQ